jgi:hypothetical protein
MKSTVSTTKPNLLPSRRLIVITVLLASFASVIGVWSRPAALVIDGERVVSDVPPVTHAQEAFVPLRAVGESLGAETNYDPRTGLVEVMRGSDTLRMHLGDREATLNGARMTLSHAPFSVRGRTMVSLSVISRAFGSKVSYDDSRAKIDVVSPGMIEAGAQQESP